VYKIKQHQIDANLEEL